MITLADLPYAYAALEPYVSAETLRLHHDKHHQAYVNAVNDLARKEGVKPRTLEALIVDTRGDDRRRALFNNAAQAWNHEFYWSSMTPNGGGAPSGEIAALIDAQFGSYDDFYRQLAAAATGHFGSGWAWLVWERGRLKVTSTANADTPIGTEQTPLLTIDVWEHAYYVDYRNVRPVYVATFLSRLVNWDFANRNLERAVATSKAAEKIPIPALSAQDDVRLERE